VTLTADSAEDAETDTVAPALLAWFADHGRRNLPWQQDRTPYRVWISEVMLQQTQVATVIDYFDRFVQRFPDVQSLASASLDEVLHAWTGLGYYSRARNLHRAAQLVVEKHGGRVPESIDALRVLPGIGRSTAGAILALACGQRHPILDGNARRVLSRHFGISGSASNPETLRCLWRIAGACTPIDDVTDYTQAIMDLGAGICTRTRPRCDVCPLRRSCMARLTDRQHELPSPNIKRPRPRREAFTLVVSCDGALLLERRPEQGVWAGLWSFPMFGTRHEAFSWLRARLGLSPERPEKMPPNEHTFTHFDLTLHPLGVSIRPSRPTVLSEELRWYDPLRPEQIGLARPVVQFLPKQSLT
jgi:A/G-specific adenine glycosylase